MNTQSANAQGLSSKELAVRFKAMLIVPPSLLKMPTDVHSASSMKIVEVNTDFQAQMWIDYPSVLYKNDPKYIPSLQKDVEDVFDRNRNRLFEIEESAVTRWLLFDEDGILIGRIAAFVNGKIFKKEEQPTGGCGFFDCIDDQDAANLLFDTAKDWLVSKDMEAMDGPVNFGERDKFWGVLVDGFKEQNYGMFYNAPYYQKLYENYGFQLYFNQYTYGREVHLRNKDFSERFYERAQPALDNPDITFRSLTGKEIEKGPEYFHHVYNNAWGGHSGVPAMSLQQVEKMFKKLKQIYDKRLMYFGFYKDEPISFFISIPELNTLFKHVDGKMNTIGKLKFLYHKYTGSCNKILGIVFGVVPEWQGKGVESAMVVRWSKIDWAPYETIEMNWCGDFNPKMMHVCEQLGGDIIKTHVTYRFLFDRNKPFKRCPIIE
ncbi:MAG: hypothetical protein ACI9UR_002829 [Bacteroidia bacterium]